MNRDEFHPVPPDHDAPFGGQGLGRLHLTGLRSASLSQAYGRIVLVSLLFTLAYLVIAIRAFDLMILQGELKSADAGSPVALAEKAETPVHLRGDIVDRNGILLATSIKTSSLYADPHLILDPVETAKGLSRIFPDLGYGDILQKLQGDKRFVWIRRNLTPSEQTAILELGQPGLAFHEDSRRIYPQGPLTAHLVGYNGIDGDGLAGIEQGFNKILTAENRPLKTTLDIRLQHILRRELGQSIRDFSAIGGTGLIMDIKTGEILAATSLPDFDPHQPGNTRPEQMFNRITLGVYELGSTMKIFSTAALLELQNTPLSQTFDASSPIRVGRFTISDFHPENRALTIPEVFMYSSNIGTARMGQQVGTEGLRAFYDDLGLLSPARFDLPEVGRPLIPNPWKDINTLTVSYGHGIAITPLQLVSATATIIGDGTRIQPRLIADEDRMEQTGRMSPAIRVVSAQTVKKMRQLLRLVVTEGTGGKADVAGLMIGGKTGTADKSSGRGYDHNKRISSFIGAFPMNDPRYLILVTVDEPKPNKSSYGYATGGWVAAPAVAKIASGMAAVLGIAPVSPDIQDPSEPLKPLLAKYKTSSENGEEASLASVTSFADH